MNNLRWATCPLWSIVTESREIVEPADLGDQVLHYSIPAFDATGAGQVEEADSIKSAKLRLRGGEVLISKLNPRKSRVLMVPPSDGPMVSSTEFVGLRAVSSLEARFLTYWLQSEATRQALDSQVQSVTRSHQRVAPEDIKRLSIDLPPVEEQRRIADFLDDETARIDRLVALQKSLGVRLDDRDRTLRDGLVNGLADAAGEAPLRRFSTRIEQGASPQCEAVPRQDDSEWGVLKLSAVKGGRFEPMENKRLPPDVKPVSAHEVRPGDLLVTRANTPSLVGDVAVVAGSHQRLLLPDLIYRVGLVPGVNAHFVAQVALSGRVRSLIESVARGSSQSMVKLRGEDIKALPIPLATPDQQSALVEQIRLGTDITGRLRTTSARQIALLAERRQALITAAVTGQFDVTTASGRNVTDGVTA
ncbi:restriction endonuclease subunit S [Streptomyces sp. NBC_00193]|uniref:restriction endonuclease subunit S n=1 Tax=Streptomyces sp. NBC_00193 TaxID=2975675 RepID=UPI002258627D|nr:restriction endonuclease subunit S [Streptomyces sp. NBC_00193]MCX5295833.1 restriction endonuclease subunit S [Streptomyces sp. NBC_00193]